MGIDLNECYRLMHPLSRFSGYAAASKHASCLRRHSIGLLTVAWERHPESQEKVATFVHTTESVDCQWLYCHGTRHDSHRTWTVDDVPCRTSVPHTQTTADNCCCCCQFICVIFIPLPTHTRLTALFPGLPEWAGTRKAKPIWIFLKQETLSGSGISWAICKSAPCSRQIATPAPHHSVFYRPDALPAAQPTVSKHWRKNGQMQRLEYWFDEAYL